VYYTFKSGIPDKLDFAKAQTAQSYGHLMLHKENNMMGRTPECYKQRAWKSHLKKQITYI